MANKPKVNSSAHKSKSPLVDSKPATQPSDVVPFAATRAPADQNPTLAKMFEFGKSGPTSGSLPPVLTPLAEVSTEYAVEPGVGIDAMELPAKITADKPESRIAPLGMAVGTPVTELSSKTAVGKPAVDTGDDEPATNATAVQSEPEIAMIAPAAKTAAVRPDSEPAAAEPAERLSAVEPTAKLAPPVIAPLITEGKATLTETFTKIEDSSQNFAGKATTGVKLVLEKGSKGMAELVEFSKGNLDAMVASSRIAASGVQEMATYATTYGRTSIEKASATAQQFAAVKSPTELFRLQSELVKSSFETFAAEASKFGETYMKLLGEIAQPLQNRYEVAAEKVRISAVA